MVWRILFFFIGNTIITGHTKCKKKLSKDVDIICALRDKLIVITFGKSYISDGQTFASLELAQQHEIITLLKSKAAPDGGPLGGVDQSHNLTIATVAAILVGNKEKVLDVLSTTASSRPRGRSINGAKRTRKAKDVAPSKATETSKAV